MYLLVCVFAFACITLHGLAEQMPVVVPPLDVQLPPHDSSRLCGPNATYLLLRLAGSKADYFEILRSFPNVMVKGASLVDIQQFLSKKSIESQLLWLSDSELVKNSPMLVATLDSSRKDPHILVKQSMSGKIVVYDVPLSPYDLPTDKISDIPKASLLVMQSRNSTPVSFILHKENLLLAFGIFGMFLGISGFILAARLKSFKIPRFLLISLLAGSILFSLTGCNSTKKAIAVCEQPVLKVGPMRTEGKTLLGTQSFLVKNHGSKILRLTNVSSSCGCSRVSMPTQIAPQDFCFVKVDFTLSPSQVSPKNIDIIVETDDPHAPTLPLKLIVQAESEPYAVPEVLRFESSHLKKSQTHYAHVYWETPVIQKDFVMAVTIEPPNAITVFVEKQTRKPVRNDDLFGSQLYMATLKIVSSGDLASDELKGKIVVEIAPSRKLSIPFELLHELKPGGTGGQG